MLFEFEVDEMMGEIEEGQEVLDESEGFTWEMHDKLGLDYRSDYKYCFQPGYISAEHGPKNFGFKQMKREMGQ